MTSRSLLAALLALGCGTNYSEVLTGDDDAGVEASAPDVGAEAALSCPTAAVACEVCDVASFPPLKMGAVTQMLDACTVSELQTYVSACFSQSATQMTCDAYVGTTKSGPCGACLDPVLTSAMTWGPFYCSNQQALCPSNQGGCVDLVLDTTKQERANDGTGSCGDSLTALYGCQRDACGRCGASDLPACLEDTSSTGATRQCASYEAMAYSEACSILQTDAAPAAVQQCFPQSDTDRVAFLNVFCGTGPM